MPQIQFLGQVPGRGAGIAEAIKGGTAAYFGMKEKKEERELNLEAISYDKRVKGANMIINAKKFMNDAQASKLDAEPKVRELFKSLDWPYPEGSLMAAPTIKFEAIKAIQEGKALEGMTMDETKKVAGVLVTEKKITAADIKAFESTVPALEKILPGKQKVQKEVMALKRRYKAQFGGGTRVGTTGDPLGVR